MKAEHSCGDGGSMGLHQASCAACQLERAQAATAPDWSAPLVRDLRDGRFHFVHREAMAEAPTLELQLEGGPQDGGTYRCPTVYPGPDGLPDGILLIQAGLRALYIRTQGLTYQHATYREKPADA